MCSDEGSYEWWHYCASGKRHPGVRCTDYWVSERQKYLDKDKDLEKYLDKDKDLDNYLDNYLDKDKDKKSNTMDKFEEKRMDWANFKKSQGKKCG